MYWVAGAPQTRNDALGDPDLKAEGLGDGLLRGEGILPLFFEGDEHDQAFGRVGDADQGRLGAAAPGESDPLRLLRLGSADGGQRYRSLCLCIRNSSRPIAASPARL